MNGNSQIPSLELQLPGSGDVAMLNQYLTTGQSRELQRLLLSESRYSNETSKLEDVSPATYMKMQDKAAEFIIREVKGKDGETKPFSFDWLGNLPIEDGNIVYNKLNEIIAGSTVTPETAKK
jgi:hypothetical protein